MVKTWSQLYSTGIPDRQHINFLYLFYFFFATIFNALSIISIPFTSLSSFVLFGFLWWLTFVGPFGRDLLTQKEQMKYLDTCFILFFSILLSSFIITCLLYNLVLWANFVCSFLPLHFYLFDTGFLTGFVYVWTWTCPFCSLLEDRVLQVAFLSPFLFLCACLVLSHLTMCLHYSLSI